MGVDAGDPPIGFAMTLVIVRISRQSLLTVRGDSGEHDHPHPHRHHEHAEGQPA